MTIPFFPVGPSCCGLFEYLLIFLLNLSTVGIDILGDLTYSYDKAGKRIATGGSFARTGLLQTLSTATYDAANQQLTLGNKSATYDNNGNLATLTDPSGTTTYTWNARNQLAALSGSSLTASFQRRSPDKIRGFSALCE